MENEDKFIFSEGIKINKLKVKKLENLFTTIQYKTFSDEKSKQKFEKDIIKIIKKYPEIMFMTHYCEDPIFGMGYLSFFNMCLENDFDLVIEELVKNKELMHTKFEVRPFGSEYPIMSLCHNLKDDLVLQLLDMDKSYYTLQDSSEFNLGMISTDKRVISKCLDNKDASRQVHLLGTIAMQCLDRNFLDLVQQAIDNEYSLDVIDIVGKTLAMRCAEKGLTDFVQQIVDKGIGLEIKDNIGRDISKYIEQFELDVKLPEKKKDEEHVR